MAVDWIVAGFEATVLLTRDDATRGIPAATIGSAGPKMNPGLAGQAPRRGRMEPPLAPYGVTSSSPSTEAEDASGPYDLEGVCCTNS